MSSVQINTSEGSLTLDKAIQKFKTHTCHKGDLVGIFRQIQDAGGIQIINVAKHVLTNAERYPAKIVEGCNRLLQKPESDTKTYEVDRLDYLTSVLEAFGSGTRVRVLFRPTNLEGLRLIVSNPNVFLLNKDDAVGLAAVSISGEWQRISKLAEMTLVWSSDAQLILIETAFGSSVQSFNTVSTYRDRRRKRLLEKVKKDENAFYDEGLFTDICREAGYSDEQISLWTSSLTTQSKLSEALSFIQEENALIAIGDAYISRLTELCAETV